MRVLLVRGTAIEPPVRRPARTSRPICSSTCPRSSTSGACRLRNGRGNHTHTPARSATDTRSRAHAFAPIPYDPRQALRKICTWAPDPRPDPPSGVPPPDGTHALSSFIFPAPPQMGPVAYRKTPTPNEFWRNVRRRGPHAYRKTPTRIEFRGNLRRRGPATRSPAFSPHGCAPGAKPWGRESHGGSSGDRGR